MQLFLSIMKSKFSKQNHRIREWQRLEETSGGWLVQSPMLIQRPLEQVAQDHVRMGFEALQKGSTTSQGNPFTHKIRCILLLRLNVLCSSLFSLPVVLSLGTTGKNPALSSLYLEYWIWILDVLSIWNLEYSYSRNYQSIPALFIYSAYRKNSVLTAVYYVKLSDFSDSY